MFLNKRANSHACMTYLLVMDLSELNENAKEAETDDGNGLENMSA